MATRKKMRGFDTCVWEWRGGGYASTCADMCPMLVNDCPARKHDPGTERQFSAGQCAEYLVRRAADPRCCIGQASHGRARQNTRLVCWIELVTA